MIDIKIEGLHVTSDDRQYTVWEEKVYTAGKSVGETYSIPVAYYTNMDSLLKGVAELL